MSGQLAKAPSETAVEVPEGMLLVAVDAFMASERESEDGYTLVHKNMDAALRAALTYQAASRG